VLCEELIEPLFCWTPELVRGSRDLLGNGTDPGNSSRQPGWSLRGQGKVASAPWRDLVCSLHISGTPNRPPVLSDRPASSSLHSSIPTRCTAAHPDFQRTVYC